MASADSGADGSSEEDALRDREMFERAPAFLMAARKEASLKGFWGACGSVVSLVVVVVDWK